MTDLSQKFVRASGLAALAIGLTIVFSALARAQDSGRPLMRQKFESVQTIFDGIQSADFEAIAAQARLLRTISTVDEILGVPGDARYRGFADHFRQSAEELANQADRKSLSGVNKAYASLTGACGRCHDALRDDGARPDLPALRSFPRASARPPAEGAKQASRGVGSARRPLRFKPHTISEEANGASAILAIDFDLDGDLDVVAAMWHDDKIAWYENEGRDRLVFAEHTISTNVEGASSIAVGDLDGDGDLDVLAGSYIEGEIHGFENRGGRFPLFRDRTIATDVGGVASLRLADLDKDGDLDLVSASHEDNLIVWHENRTRKSGLNFLAHEITASADGACSVFPVDLDRDGTLDIVAASPDDGTVVWFRSNGKSPLSFERRVVTTSAIGVHDVFAADFDRDGDMDIVVAADLIDVSRRAPAVSWYENLGGANPTFRAHAISFSSIGARSVFAVDTDLDGNIDIVVGSSYGSWGVPSLSPESKLAIFENRGTSPPSFLERVIDTAEHGHRSVVAADLDGDGDPDLLSALFMGERLIWYENQIN